MDDRDKEKFDGRNEDDRPSRKIIIEDKRFSRDDDEADEQSESKVPEEAKATASKDESYPVGLNSAHVSEEHGVADSERRRFEVVEEPAFPPAADPTSDIPIADDFADDFPDGDAFRELTPEDEERLRNAAKEQLAALSRIGIENYLREIFNVAYILSLQYLGLQPNPNTGLTVRDSKRAALSIDVIDYMRKRLDEYLLAGEKVQLSQLVAALQIEFSKVPPPPKPPKE